MSENEIDLLRTVVADLKAEIARLHQQISIMSDDMTRQRNMAVEKIARLKRERDAMALRMVTTAEDVALVYGLPSKVVDRFRALAGERRDGAGKPQWTALDSALTKEMET